jgi:hypothetical protein
MKLQLIILKILILIFFLSPSLLKATVKVIRITGKASYSATGKWQPLTNGLTLKRNTRIMTGVRSSVILNFDGHIVTLRSLSKMKIYQNIRSSKNSINRIGLRYGSVNAKIKKIKKLNTVFKISTPVATSSVRGTEEEVSYWKSKGMRIFVISGYIVGESKHGELATISGKQVFKLLPDYVRPNHLLENLFYTYYINITDPNVNIHEKDNFIDSSVNDVDNNDIFLGTPTSKFDQVNNVQIFISITYP